MQPPHHGGFRGEDDGTHLPDYFPVHLLGLPSWVNRRDGVQVKGFLATHVQIVDARPAAFNLLWARESLALKMDLSVKIKVEIGYADLRANQKKFAETAARIDSKKTPKQILDEMEKDHPPADKLLDAFRNTLGGLTKFIEERKIVTIPSPVPPILEETLRVLEKRFGWPAEQRESARA